MEMAYNVSLMFLQIWTGKLGKKNLFIANYNKFVLHVVW